MYKNIVTDLSQVLRSEFDAIASEAEIKRNTASYIYGVAMQYWPRRHEVLATRTGQESHEAEEFYRIISDSLKDMLKYYLGVPKGFFTSDFSDASPASNGFVSHESTNFTYAVAIQLDWARVEEVKRTYDREISIEKPMGLIGSLYGSNDYYETSQAQAGRFAKLSQFQLNFTDEGMKIINGFFEKSQPGASLENYRRESHNNPIFGGRMAR